MFKRFLSFSLAAMLVVASVMPSQAKGRKPEDDDKDNFPDYNRMERRANPKPASEATAPAATTPPAPVQKQPLNTPVNWTPEDDTTPKAPPKAIPVPDNSSEPPLPDDMLGTLVPSTTAQ